jgi:integrase
MRKRANGDEYWTGKWFFDVTIKGKRYTEYDENAEDLARRLEYLTVTKGNYHRAIEGMGKLHARVHVPKYLSYCEKTRGMAKSTLDYKRRILEKDNSTGLAFAEYFWKTRTPLKQIETRDLEEWLTKIHELKGGSAWVRYRKELSAFWRWFLKAEPRHIKSNPVIAVDDKEMRPPTKPRYCPTRKEMEKLLEVIENGSGERIGDFTADEAVIKFAMLSWARHKEIMRMKWNQVDFENGFFCLPEEKGSREMQKLRMSPDIEKILEGAWENSINREFVFETSNPSSIHYGGPLSRSFDTLVQSYCKKAGITVFGWHSLRHRGATNYARKEGASVAELMYWGRWKKMEVAQGYIDRAKLGRKPIGGDLSDL